MDKFGKKDFSGWIRIKEKIHFSGSMRTINVGEIWWCRIGENVGNEICGKGKDFLRPVLIIKKINKNNFIGVPLTSKKHVGSWYVEFGFKGKKQYAVVAQVEYISVFRLSHKMGQVPESDLKIVLDGLMKLLTNKS
ncbi:MAG: type II toxin-antitoxin system PemK/MazF family toxin [Methanobrevibacter sp.]|nr:type II toxin-antitoxin system PemK/MazF family toxin [Methanobrevibacter sp.]